MTAADELPIMSDEVKHHLRMIDQFGAEAAAAQLAGQDSLALVKRVLLNRHSDAVGVLLS